MSEDLAQRVEDLEQRVFALENAPKGGAPAAAPGAKPLSIREFVISKGPKTSVDTTLLVGFYLEKFAGTSPFNLEDVTRGFAQAKEPLPANPSDMLYKNVKRGFLMESAEKKGGSKSWIVTNSGERHVENGLKEG